MRHSSLIRFGSPIASLLHTRWEYKNMKKVLVIALSIALVSSGMASDTSYSTQTARAVQAAWHKVHNPTAPDTLTPLIIASDHSALICAMILLFQLGHQDIIMQVQQEIISRKQELTYSWPQEQLTAPHGPSLAPDPRYIYGWLGVIFAGIAIHADCGVDTAFLDFITQHNIKYRPPTPESLKDPLDVDTPEIAPQPGIIFDFGSDDDLDLGGSMKDALGDWEQILAAKNIGPHPPLGALADFFK